MKICEETAGVDEAGRGCLAGPVFAAAVILNPAQPIPGLKDSKKLSAKQRDYLFKRIQGNAIWAVGIASVKEIYELNILQASLLAMERAVRGLHLSPVHALIDGNHCPKQLPCEATAIVGGDNHVPAICAASIVAKVLRDNFMVKLGKIYHAYGFEKHKGYGTRAHLLALKKHGITPYHRLGFAPVKRQLLLEVVI